MPPVGAYLLVLLRLSAARRSASMTTFRFGTGISIGSPFLG